MCFLVILVDWTFFKNTLHDFIKSSPSAVSVLKQHSDRGVVVFSKIHGRFCGLELFGGQAGMAVTFCLPIGEFLGASIICLSLIQVNVGHECGSTLREVDQFACNII